VCVYVCVWVCVTKHPLLECQIKGILARRNKRSLSTLNPSPASPTPCPPSLPSDCLKRAVVEGIVRHHLPHTAKLCNTLQHAAPHCNTLQHAFTHVAWRAHTAASTHCNTLQHAATRCNTLQHAATHCNTLQHAATRCNKLRCRHASFAAL